MVWQLGIHLPQLQFSELFGSAKQLMGHTPDQCFSPFWIKLQINAFFFLLLRKDNTITIANPLWKILKYHQQNILPNIILT